MVTYMTMPQFQIIVGASTYTNDKAIDAKVTRVENGFDIATLTFPDQYTTLRSTLIAGETVHIGVKDASDGAYTNQLSGIARFRTETLRPENIILKCESMGFPLAECLVGQEYGVQSSNTTLDTLLEILTDASAGIIPKWVEKILNTATDSEYAVDTSKIETITGSINYLYFPFKPASKCLADILNVVQAIKGANAGPHWIMTTSGGINYLRIRLVDGTQAGWTKYYGDSQANATLAQGTDFLDGTFETLTNEANYVLYHSPFLWPGDRDYRTEIDTNWASPDNLTVTIDAAVYKVGANSVKSVSNNHQPFQTLNYPSVGNLNLDITKAGGTYNLPTFNFWMYVDGNFDLTADGTHNILDIKFLKTAIVYSLAGVDLTKALSGATAWNHISFPIGPNWLREYQPGGAFQGIADAGGSPWDDIVNIQFIVHSQPSAPAATFYIDGMNIAGYVLRGAYNSTKIAANGLKTRFINDPFGKDDTLKATDDSGSAARFAYAELLRSQSTPVVGAIVTPMIKDLLPGQFLHIHARPNSSGTFQIDMDMRVTQVTQHFNQTEYTSTIALTSDVTNSFARAAYDSVNEVTKNYRPEFQDRQTTGIKMRDVDITQTVLSKDYP